MNDQPSSIGVRSPERWMMLAAVGVVGVILIWTLSSYNIAAGFRQAQTGISSYWMLHGGPWLDYWTPVLGYPWAVPFEFPLYQWMVAGLAATGVDVAPAGALISFGWLIFSLWPVSYLARSYELPALSRACLYVLFLLAPVYLDMGTALMIETQALALGLAWLALLRGFLVTRSPGLLVIAMLVGVLAALTKVTTMPSCLLLGGLMTLLDAWQDRGRPGRACTTLVAALLMVLPMIAATMAWNGHADALKALNPNAEMLRSDTPFIIRWNFGTLDQRYSPRLAKALVRILLDTLGPMGIVLLPVVIVFVWRKGVSRRTGAMLAALLAAFFLPILILTNLYIQHGYYQTANTIFAIAAYAVLLGELATERRQFALMLLALSAASQLVWFVAFHRSSLYHPVDDSRAIAVGRALHDWTPSNGVVAIYGLDWSSVAPFYAERKSIMETDWADLASRHRRLDQLFKPVGGQPMAAVVRCPSALDADPALQARFSELDATHRHRRVATCTIYFAQPPMPTVPHSQPA